MRNKSITALWLFVGIAAVPFSVAAESGAYFYGCIYGSCPTPIPIPTPPTPTPPPPPANSPACVYGTCFPPNPPTCTVNENFESGGAGWVASNASTCATGHFVLGEPSRQSLRLKRRTLVTQPGSESGNAWFTAFNTSRGKDDVDDGTCILDSPIWQVDEDSKLSLWYFHGQKDSDDDDEDFFSLDVSINGGATFEPLVSIGDERTNASWTRATMPIPAGSKVTISLQVADGASNNDLIEGGLDDIKICPQN